MTSKDDAFVVSDAGDEGVLRFGEEPSPDDRMLNVKEQRACRPRKVILRIRNDMSTMISWREQLVAQLRSAMIASLIPPGCAGACRGLQLFCPAGRDKTSSVIQEYTVKKLRCARGEVFRFPFTSLTNIFKAVTALESSKLFSGLAPDESERIRTVAQKRTYPPDQVIFEEGDAGDGIYVIESGWVGISALVGGTERRNLARVGPGDFFGEMAVLDNEPRSGSAVTQEDTVAYFISRDDLLGLLDSSPRLAVRLMKEFSLKMRDFNRRYIEEVLQAERLTLVGRFARSIVHDFKNPLNVIGLAADLVRMDASVSPTRNSAAIRIRKQVDRLSNMINELLEFTRGSQNPVVLSAADFPRFITSLLADLTPELQVKNVELVVEGEPPDLPVLLDPHRLTHVFYNLCHNAVDAMPEGGKIMMRFHPKPRELVIELEDTGQGIAPEIAPRLFEAFATFGKVQGTGLGLSICKRIIDDHRGWIKAVSSHGRGAVFMFGLPLAQETQPAVAATAQP